MTRIEISLPAEKDAELRRLKATVDELFVRLGRADFEVAKAEAARHAVRVELDNELRGVQSLVDMAAKQLEVPGPTWNFDMNSMTFVISG